MRQPQLGIRNHPLKSHSVLALSAANWVAQITFGQEPLAQVSGSRPSPPKK
jgi:hypothetical protein